MPLVNRELQFNYINNCQVRAAPCQEGGQSQSEPILILDGRGGGETESKASKGLQGRPACPPRLPPEEKKRAAPRQVAQFPGVAFPSRPGAMAASDPDFVLRCLAEVEALAEEVMATRQQIFDLNQKRNQNREALRALSKNMDSADKATVCFGAMFIQLPKTKTREMLQRDQELLEEEIAKLQEELKGKVSHLMEAQGKPELKGFNLKPLTAEEMWFMKKVVDN
ncbi:p53 and DNA damage-regulated protein 1-like [Crotalus adamanteus]|uniref:P53 and DNA damage-regulated protein 1-like n=1 Tax=Crotalus adamanteus TaxID=8729 RepID=A0AAW1BS35_CROAD